MAYNRPANLASGAILTEAWVDAVVDSFTAGVPDIFTTAGDTAYATAADTAARLALGTTDAFLVAAAAAPAWQIAPACKVRRLTDQDPAQASWVTIDFASDGVDATEDIDTDGMHSFAANTSRLTVPALGAGLYMVGGCVEFDSTGAGEANFGVQILKSGAGVLVRRFGDMAQADDQVISVSTLCSLAVAAYVELQVYTEGNFDVKAQANYSPVLWAQWVRMP